MNDKNNMNKNIEKCNSMKMQDFFGISEQYGYNTDNQKKENKQKEREENKNYDNGLFDPKSSLYNSIYQSTIQFDDFNDNKEDQKPKVALQRKNNLLNYKKGNSNEELSYIEPIRIFIDDLNKKDSEIIIQNYECKFIFDDQVQHEFIHLL